MLNAPHLLVYLREHLGTLLQTEYDILLYQRELDARCEFLELFQLRVGLGEERFLVFLAAEGEQGALLVAGCEHLFGDFGFFGGEEGDASLVLVEFVALGFEVVDCSG